MPRWTPPSRWEPTKRYGNVVGVHDLTLDLAPGEVLGLLGPNGAGKTTTIRVVPDLIRPTEGSVRVIGLDARKGSVAIRSRLGYLPGNRSTPASSSATSPGYGATRRLSASPVSPSGSTSISTARFVCFRAGTGRRSASSRRSPDLLVLDEPTTELDPLMPAVVHELVREAAWRGAAVFFSSS